MSRTFDIRVGAKVSYDGTLCTIVELARDSVVLVDASNRARRVRLIEILRDAGEAFGASTDDAVASPHALLWAEATDEQRDEAQRKAAHVREVRTGFTSGLSSMPLPGEPRREYNVTLTSIHERRRAKAGGLTSAVTTRYAAQKRGAWSAAIRFVIIRTRPTCCTSTSGGAA